MDTNPQPRPKILTMGDFRRLTQNVDDDRPLACLLPTLGAPSPEGVVVFAGGFTFITDPAKSGEEKDYFTLIGTENPAVS